jgi:outer membrane protein assembly factor BamB
MVKRFLLISCFAFWTVTAADNWPQFRGPNGAGIGTGNFPTHFGPSSNVLWNVAVPSGHSSPCLWENRIFLTGHADDQLQVMSLDRDNGRLLWSRSISPGKIERGSHLSHPATATPVTDGKHLFVYFGSVGLLCFDHAGNEVWRKSLPVPVTQHGPGTSPVLVGEMLILACDQDVDSYLLAVNARNGQTIWRTERPGFHRGFSTPLPWPPRDPQQIILPGTLRLVSYQLTDGSERWSVRGLPNEMVASPIAAGDLVFVAGWTHGSGVGRMPLFEKLLEQADANQDEKLTRNEAPAGPAKQHFLYLDADKDGLLTRAEYEKVSRAFDESKNIALAVRPDGQGDVTETHVAWTAARGLPYVPTPLFYEGRIYLVKNGGLVSCFDAQNGKIFYQEERLGAIGDYYASPVAAAGKIIAASQPGVLVVYRAAGTLEVLARNALNEPVLATPAIVDGVLYVRTKASLYAFGDSLSAHTAFK